MDNILDVVSNIYIRASSQGVGHLYPMDLCHWVNYLIYFISEYEIVFFLLFDFSATKHVKTISLAEIFDTFVFTYILYQKAQKLILGRIFRLIIF